MHISLKVGNLYMCSRIQRIKSLFSCTCWKRRGRYVLFTKAKLTNEFLGKTCLVRKFTQVLQIFSLMTLDLTEVKLGCISAWSNGNNWRRFYDKDS